jgi:hypothetical protein
MASAPRGFDVSALLEDRVQRLERDLKAARDAVDATPKTLRSRLTGGLLNEIAQVLQSIESDLATPLRERRLHPADAWARLHAKHTRADALLAECLILSVGADVRARTRDEPAIDGWRGSGSRICDIADALIDEMVARTPMAGWDSFTILGTAESFDYASRVIVVRFPDPTIWDLSATAHELGHYAARTIGEFRNGRMYNLVDDLHRDLDPAGSHWYWVEELFGDAFATWMLGPAYGLTCVTLAFDPLEANVNSESHPPNSARIGMITAVLDASSDDDVRWFGPTLMSLWQQLVDVSEAEVAQPGPSVSDPWVERIVGMLADRLPYSRYSTFVQAQGLASDLAVDRVNDETRLADVVNAAWLARVQVGGRVGFDDVSLSGTALAQAMVRRGS